ncbi:MAG: hypothetical protein ACRD2Z_06255 [Thermoanaerobaculia bacterium]
MKTSFLTISSALAITALGGSVPVASAQDRTATATPAPRMLARPQLEDVKAPELGRGAAITAFEMTWREAEPEIAQKLLAGALAVVLGEEPARRVAGREVLAAAVRGEEVGTWTRLPDSPVLVRYDTDYDEIRILYEELEVANVAVAGRDIGERRAQELAEAYLERLGKAGAVDDRLYENAALQIGYAMAGDGPVEKEVRPGRVVEYRFTFRPRLKGIELANAGVRLGILASGELTGLRLGGVTPQGEWRRGELVSTVGDSERRIRVGVDELMQRFYKNIPRGAEPQVAWSRVMYVMPEGRSEAVVEPMLIVSYTLQTEVQGERVVSRRKTLGFSLTDPEAAPIDFDAPAAKHEETELSRPGRPRR